MSTGLVLGAIFGAFTAVGGQNPYTDTARRSSPHKHLEGSLVTSFLPVEALEFSELKTHLVYTFFPPKLIKDLVLLTALREAPSTYGGLLALTCLFLTHNRNTTTEETTHINKEL